MSTELRILFLEDDPLDAELIIATLEEAGYACQWERVETRSAFLAGLDAPDYDLILADYNLPAFDGLTALQLFCERRLDLPFILVSGTLGEETAIESLKAGATDYVLKDRLSRLAPAVGRALREKEEQRQRRRAEEALRESEMRLRCLTQSASDAIISADGSGKIVSWNAAAQTMFGFTEEEALGQLLTILMPAPYVVSYQKGFERFLTTGESRVIGSTIELDGLRKDGSEFPVGIALSNWKVGDENYFAAIIRDITERKRAEEEVRRHLERIEALREIDRAVTSTLDLTEVLDIILEELERVIPYHSAAIFLLSDGTAELTAGRGFPDLERVLQISFPVKEDALTHELLQEKRSLVLADAQADERFRARGDTGYIRSWIGVPLIVKEKAVGFLTIDHREPGVYDEDSADMAQAFAGQVAIAVENARLYEEAQRELAERKRAEEALQYRVEFERLIATLSTHFIDFVPDEVDSEINHALQAIGEFADVDRSYVILFSDNETKMDNTHEWCAEGIEPQIDNLQGVPVEVIPWWVDKLNRFEIIHIPRVADLPPEARAEKEILQAQDIQSLIVVPLAYGGSLIGFLGFDSVRAERTWSEDIIVLLRIVGEVIANALEHKRADEELQDSLEKLREALGGIIQTVALTVETRDPYTAGHQRRVANLARAIATEMGLSEDQIEGIRMAGVIHDLGKIGVPTEILSWPGRLNDLQFGLIKMHSQIGYDILKTVEFPWPVAQIVLQHHERLDGSGYPQGLSGEEILLEARILAVADVVEAMASRRPYRPPRGLDKALEEISQNRDVLYAPEVVDACLKLFTEKGFELE